MTDDFQRVEQDHKRVFSESLHKAMSSDEVVKSSFSVTYSTGAFLKALLRMTPDEAATSVARLVLHRVTRPSKDMLSKLPQTILKARDNIILASVIVKQRDEYLPYIGGSNRLGLDDICANDYYILKLAIVTKGGLLDRPTRSTNIFDAWRRSWGLMACHIRLCDGLRYAALSNHIDLITYFMRNWGLGMTAADVTSARVIPSVATLSWGSDVLSALELALGVGKKEVPLAQLCEGAIAAAQWGKIDFIRSLREKWGLEYASPVVYNSSEISLELGDVLAFESAKCGHAHVIQHLTRYWGLTSKKLKYIQYLYDPEYFRRHPTEVYRAIIKHGVYPFGGGSGILKIAAQRNHVNVLTLLSTEYKFGAEDALYNNAIAIQLAAEAGSTAALVFMRTVWGTGPWSSPVDTTVVCLEAIASILRAAIYNNRIAVLSELANGWGLGDEVAVMALEQVAEIDDVYKLVTLLDREALNFVRSEWDVDPKVLEKFAPDNRVASQLASLTRWVSSYLFGARKGASWHRL